MPVVLMLFLSAMLNYICFCPPQTVWPYLMHYSRDEIAVVDAVCMVSLDKSLAQLPCSVTGGQLTMPQLKTVALQIGSPPCCCRGAALQVHQGSSGEGKKRGEDSRSSNYLAAQQASPFRASGRSD